MSAMKLDENGHDRRATSPVADAVAAEQVDYPRILYVCEHCQENAPEMCGRSRDDLYVTPSGQWLCDACIDEEGVPISDCVPPPALYPASTVARLQQEIQRLKAAELAEAQQRYVDANEARIDAEAQLAERAEGVNEDALRALAQAYDREDAAQRGDTGELIDKMAEAIRGDTTSDDAPWATLSEDRKIGWRGDAERALAVVKEYLTAHSPSEQAVTEADKSDDAVAELFVAAWAEADKAMRKFPQPNYVISKVAEEAGEVVKAAIHCAEGRETPANVIAEIRQTMAMLLRLYVEGDQVHGLPPLKAAMEAGR